MVLLPREAACFRSRLADSVRAAHESVLEYHFRRSVSRDRRKLHSLTPAAASAESHRDSFHVSAPVLTTDLRDRSEGILGHTFNNPDLLSEALTHASIADTRLKSNERMEFLGDAVLDLVICEALYRKFPQCNERDLTTIKSAVVSRRD